MRLNKGMKAAIIKHIMQDLPSEDYETQARDKFQKACEAVLPKEVKELSSTHKQRLNRYWANLSRVSPSRDNYYLTCCVMGMDDEDLNAIPQSVVTEVHALLDLRKEQGDKMNRIRRELDTSFAGLNTRKQVLEVYPKFEKYLPEAVERTKHLPTTTNVVESLTSAGWPKAADK